MIRTYAYKDIKIEEIFAREEEKTNVADVVAQIIAEVRKGGDAALKRYAEQFDGAAPAVFEVSEEERAYADRKGDGGVHFYCRSCDERRKCGRSESAGAYGRYRALF